MAIKNLEVCKVTPPPDSSIEMYLPLTFFDLLLAVAPPVEHLLFYEVPLLSTTSTIVLKLKQSLSLTLKHFLPFAGNVIWPLSSPKPVFSYEKGDGILLTVAHCDAGQFYHLSSNKDLRESKAIQSLVAQLVGSDSVSPLVAVKVTIFPNKGFCIGITNHSAACDGKAMSMFLKTWASFSKFGKSTEPKPVFDRESVRERHMKIENFYIEVIGRKNRPSQSRLAIWKSVPPLPTDSVRGTFLISGLQVTKLKEIVAARLQNNQASYISTFTVTYAYVVLCMVKAKTIPNNHVRVLFNYDCRMRLEPPLSENYTGSCVGVCFMHFDKKELLERDGFMMIVNSIQMKIKDLNNNGALRGAIEWLPNVVNEIADIESMEIYVSGSSRFGLHSIDFGWGRPLKMDIMEKGGITFKDVGDGGGGKGIEVDLCLSKSEMDKFASIFSQGLSKLMENKHTLIAAL